MAQENSPEAVGTPNASEEVKGADTPNEQELDEMTGGLNLVNKATCSSGSMNTVVSLGTV